MYIYCTDRLNRIHPIGVVHCTVWHKHNYFYHFNLWSKSRRESISLFSFSTFILSLVLYTLPSVLSVRANVSRPIAALPDSILSVKTLGDWDKYDALEKVRQTQKAKKMRLIKIKKKNSKLRGRHVVGKKLKKKQNEDQSYIVYRGIS